MINFGSHSFKNAGELQELKYRDPTEYGEVLEHIRKSAGEKSKLRLMLNSECIASNADDKIDVDEFIKAQTLELALIDIGNNTNKLLGRVKHRDGTEEYKSYTKFVAFFARLFGFALFKDVFEEDTNHKANSLLKIGNYFEKHTKYVNATNGDNIAQTDQVWQFRQSVVAGARQICSRYLRKHQDAPVEGNTGENPSSKLYHIINKITVSYLGNGSAGEGVGHDGGAVDQGAPDAAVEADGDAAVGDDFGVGAQDRRDT